MLMSSTRVRALVVALFALALAASPARAAAPVAPDYNLNAAPTGTLDALAQASDPDGDAFTLSANSQPGHGSASCTSLGACLYRADGGYTGSDSFTYTVSANGDTATGTIHVSVSESSASSALEARDDDVATRADHAVDFNVLTNDSGSSPSLTNNGDPKHGSVTCQSNGDCHYVPDAGYSGSDGFTYTISDNSESTRSAAVHILVAPAGAGYGISVNGAPVDGFKGSVPAGGQARWGVVIAPRPDGITGEELAALGFPSATLGLSGPHAPTGGSLQLAPGWSGDTSSIKAGKDALLGEGETRTFPRPLPPISQGTGGDGHVPILVGSKVFAFYHHSFPTSVTCVDRATGSICPGYPKSIPFGTTDVNGPGVVSGSKIYVHLLPSNFYAQSAPVALFCWDAQTNSTCGLTIVDRVETTQNPGASAPQSAGGKMWFGGDTGKLYCVDPANGAPCSTPSIDTGQPTTQETYWDSVAHGNRVFLGRRGGSVSCVDVSAGTTCPGWSTPKSFLGNWNVVNQHDANGTAIGVCAFHFNNGACITDADPSTSIPISNWVSRDLYANGYEYSQEAEFGTRTLVGSLDSTGFGCYDWSTMAPCTGGDYGTNGAPAGWVNHQSNGGSLPSRGAYGITSDGSCAVALGDNGQVFTGDPAGSAPCTSLGSGADRMQADLRDQRCDNTVGSATWRDVKLTDTDASEMESLVVTVRDARSGEVLKSGDLIADSTLDLSGISAADHPSLTVDGNAKAKSGTKAWDDGIPPRITLRWHGDPQPACLQTTGRAECGEGTVPIGLNGHLASPTEADASAGLSLLRPACATPIAKGEVLSATARKCSGARLFKIRVRYKGSKVRRVTVVANGKSQKVLKLRPRPIASIDLRGRMKETTVVKITIYTKSGKKLTGKRVYHPCTKKLPDRGFKY